VASGEPDTESRLEHVLVLLIGVPIAFALFIFTPLAVLIGLPWMGLHNLGLPNLYAGLVAVPLGVAGVALMYWMLATGRATWED
jgi:hypothetical protein